MDIVTDRAYLRQPSLPVRVGEEDIQEIVDLLFTELKARSNAVGLSANQFHSSLRICVMNNDPYPPICLVNPVIVKQKGHQDSKETCLSLPDVGIVIIQRPMSVIVKYSNRYGKPVRSKFLGFPARIVCHEVDHLNGILIIDKPQEVLIPQELLVPPSVVAANAMDDEKGGKLEAPVLVEEPIKAAEPQEDIDAVESANTASELLSRMKKLREG